MADLEAAFKETEVKVVQSEKALEERVARQQADDRSLIAKIIVWAFVVLVCITVLAAIASTFWHGWSEFVEPAKFLMSILGSVMLPVVTLVIGYYFSSK
jgi:hypothetical protein